MIMVKIERRSDDKYILRQFQYYSRTVLQYLNIYLNFSSKILEYNTIHIVDHLNDMVLYIYIYIQHPPDEILP